jgi:predicted aldo/keto reductase-like oxidoreductase
MIYKELGRTGLKASRIGFGGMRFKNPHDSKSSIAIIKRALELGINYFDTAPVYCDSKSEELLGEALKNEDVIISTKSSASNGKKLITDLEHSLKKLKRDVIDVFHIWCVMTLEDYYARKTGLAVEAALKAKEKKLIKHLFISTHMEGKDIAKVVKENIFEGITLGLSVVNAPYRMEGVKAAAEANLAVVCMNPLAGGTIPQRPEYFSNIKSPDDISVVIAALRYVLSIDGVTTALVGFGDVKEVDEAVKAVTPFVQWKEERMKKVLESLRREHNALCTGCSYCIPCPKNIDIPKLLQAWNNTILSGKDSAVIASLENDWDISAEMAALCVECGSCEKKCTQKLPIIDRLKAIKTLKK